jgi:hypothetical protein
MKPQKLTTEDTEKKNFRFFKNSVNSVIASSQKEIYFKRSNGMTAMRAQRGGRKLSRNFLYINLFSVLSLRSAYCWLRLIFDNTRATFWEASTEEIKKRGGGYPPPLNKTDFTEGR